MEDKKKEIEEKLDTEAIKVKSSIAEAIERNKELVGKLILIGSALVLTAVLCIMLGLKPNQTALVLSIVFLIAVLLWRLPREIEHVEERRGRVQEGWFITWADRFGHYKHAPKESTLVLTYGKYIVYDDGTIESVPDTYHYIFYKTKEMPMFINPLVQWDWYLLQKLIVEKGLDVVWADGTDRYLTVFERELKTMGVSV